MAPIKSAITRSLRSLNANHQQSFLKGVNRTLTATTKNSTNLSTHQSEQTSTLPFNKPDQPFLISGKKQPLFHRTRRQTPQISEFNGLLSALAHALTTSPRPSVQHLHSLLRSYTSDPTHWSKYARADPEKQYTRNLVCEVPGVFNLLLLVWTPGKRSPVHDHADAHCLMKVLKGEINETRYAIPGNPGEEGPLVQTSSRDFGLNKVTYMADQLGLHSISNPHPTEYAASLHLYTPPNAALRGCNIYDTENGECRHVMQGAYDSVGGQAV